MNRLLLLWVFPRLGLSSSGSFLLWTLRDELEKSYTRFGIVSTMDR